MPSNLIVSSYVNGAGVTPNIGTEMKQITTRVEPPKELKLKETVNADGKKSKNYVA